MALLSVNDKPMDAARMTHDLDGPSDMLARLEKAIWRHGWWVLILIGMAMRLYRFGVLPAGIAPDEVSAFYEAYCLMQTGADRWGNAYPVYFPSWGSGQNVLYSYVMWGFFEVFGVSTLVARLPVLLMSLGTIYFVWRAGEAVDRPAEGRYAAALLAVAPWHLHASRWGLESYFLPLFLAWGIAWLAAALHQPTRLRIIRTAIPLALAFYSYAIVMFVLPTLLLLVLSLYHRRIMPHWRTWLVAGLVAMVLIAPFGLFITKNYVVKAPLPGESLLPFGLPMLASQRATIGDGSLGHTLYHNGRFALLHGFDDTSAVNTNTQTHAHGGLMLWLAATGAVLAVFQLRRRRVQLWPLLLIAASALLLMFELNGNRGNAILITFAPLAAVALVVLRDGLTGPLARTVVVGGLLLGLTGQGLHWGYYFVTDFHEHGVHEFDPEIGRSLHAAVGAARDGESIAVSRHMQFGYLYTAYELRVDPQVFHRADREVVDGRYRVYGFDRYVMQMYANGRRQLAGAPHAVFVERVRDEPPMHAELIWRGERWHVFRAAPDEVAWIRPTLRAMRAQHKPRSGGFPAELTYEGPTER